MQQLLTESTTHLKQWRSKILTAVGANGQVIIDVIPEVELIIGKQSEVPQLGGLSISHQIVTETHGGNLYCLSSPGNGAEFVIELPLEEDSEQ